MFWGLQRDGWGRSRREQKMLYMETEFDDDELVQNFMYLICELVCAKVSNAYKFSSKSYSDTLSLVLIISIHNIFLYGYITLKINPIRVVLTQIHV